jgi:RNA polymerase-binding transcription factor DksA
MNQALLEKIKANLEEREQKLRRELEDLTGQSASDGQYQLQPPDYGTDEDENSAEVATFTTDLSVKEVLESSLRDVRSALDRIEAGTYGICKYCRQPIDERRLLARPASSSCVNCKESIKANV